MFVMSFFSGDLEESGWKKLLERMPELKCEILKMPHHGAFYDRKKWNRIETNTRNFAT